MSWTPDGDVIEWAEAVERGDQPSTAWTCCEHDGATVCNCQESPRQRHGKRRAGRPAADLTGRLFGEWLVIDRVPGVAKNASWTCRCSCGRYADIRVDNLTTGKSTRCSSCASAATAPRWTAADVSPDFPLSAVVIGPGTG